MMAAVFINRPLSGKQTRFRHGGVGLRKRTVMANWLLLVLLASTFYVLRHLNLTGLSAVREAIAVREAMYNLNSPLQTMQPLLHPRVYEIESLKHITLAHGTFYFGLHSHQVQIDPTYEPLLNSMQQELLDDDVIDVQKEKERCERYNYELVDEANPKRRRLFLGSLLGDDSMEVLRAHGTEAYNIFHTVSFIESNSTLNMSPKKWKYHDRENPSERLNTLYQLFGPKTKVSVEYYVTSLEELFGSQSDLSLEYCQREGSAHRWALNGMRPDDIGILSDADETFTRDFLRAMQICDVPEFRPNQDCMRPKVLASTIVMESSPNCVTKDRRWWHPDAILGECVEHVGNSSLHPPAKREYNDRHGLRAQGHGSHGNFTAYWSENSLEPDSGVYPTWKGVDFRRAGGGSQATEVDGSPTGYHFHNFFTGSEAIHVKYHTYGHAAKDAMDKPLWELHDDIQLAVDCATGRSNEKLELNTSSSEWPIYYLNDVIRRRRHGAWQSIVAAEEEYWTSAQNKFGKEYNATKYLQS
ncbi:hypothetical protein ACHAWU_007763 [Discostella pseudostelligera]|uniref:Glycosyltransferase family 31 protein n=1 Tax=Discostella pseudostelligera TaxID=259834 RepID=A0ABD3MLJ6_9STRA